VLDGPYPSRTKSGAKRKFPWDETDVGQHFIVKDRTAMSFGGTLAYANESREPKRFRCRTVGPDLEIRRVK
jgi:hypothetical protein